MLAVSEKAVKSANTNGNRAILNDITAHQSSILCLIDFKALSIILFYSNNRSVVFYVQITIDCKNVDSLFFSVFFVVESAFNGTQATLT